MTHIQYKRLISNGNSRRPECAKGELHSTKFDFDATLNVKVIKNFYEENHESSVSVGPCTMPLRKAFDFS